MNLDYQKIKEFITFCLVGGVGFLISVALTYILTEYAHIWYLLSFAISALFSWTVIFFLNLYFTFKISLKGTLFQKYIQFISGYIILFALNIGLVYIFTSLF